MRLLLAFTLALNFTLSMLAQAQNANLIQATGCVEPGVETSCIVLKDTKTGDTYNLFFSSKVPKPGSAIWFEGTPHQGMTTCMQGRPVDVTKWKRIKSMNCLPSDATQHPQ